MTIQIISDGTPHNTRVVNADTHEPIDNITKVEWVVELEKPARAVLYLNNVSIIAKAEADEAEQVVPGS
jgi:hypothetical protein